jgi:tetratricopeptide (TPR) repeat protein
VKTNSVDRDELPMLTDRTLVGPQRLLLRRWQAGKARMPQPPARKLCAWIAPYAACLLALSSGCRTFCPRSLEQNVVDARSSSLQGLDAMQRGRWADAEQSFAAAVKSCPVDERAQACYADALWHQGSSEQALVHMQEAARLSGNDPQRLVQLGDMHLAMQQLDHAVHCADQAIAKNNRLACAWALRGNIRLAQGRHDDALAAYHRCLALGDHQPQVQLAIAKIYRQQGRPQRALATLGSLTEQYAPGEPPIDVVVLHGTVLQDLQRHREAVQQFAQAVSRGSASGDLLCQLAQSQLQSGDASGAEASIAAALQREPQHVAALGLQAELQSRSPTLAAQVKPKAMR